MAFGYYLIYDTIMWSDMKNRCYKCLPFFLILLLCTGCSEQQHDAPKVVTFDVGFERFKTDQDVIKGADGKEEVYFLKARFNPCILFYDLDGNKTDSIPLTQIEREIGRISRISLVTKDTIIVQHDMTELYGIRRDNSLLCKIDLLSFTDRDDNNIYVYIGSLMHANLVEKDAVVLTPIWDDCKLEKKHNSLLEYIRYIFEGRMTSAVICKLDSIFSPTPKMTFGLRNFYYNKSDTIKSYDVIGMQYVIENHQLFFIPAHDRNIYRMDWETMTVADTIQIIPDEYEIPKGIPFAGREDVNEDALAEAEIQEKCRITNLLYNECTHRYYVFLRTAPDDSPVDEYGYPFNIYVYDESFRKVKTLSVKSDLYNPKGAMMTSRGLMIERTPRDKEYGKRTFEFWNL